MLPLQPCSVTSACGFTAVFPDVPQPHPGLGGVTATVHVPRGIARLQADRGGAGAPGRQGGGGTTALRGTEEQAPGREGQGTAETVSG